MKEPTISAGELDRRLARAKLEGAMSDLALQQLAEEKGVFVGYAPPFGGGPKVERDTHNVAERLRDFILEVIGRAGMVSL